MWFMALFFVILVFGLAILFGAPYLPTMQKKRQEALKLLDLKPGQTLLDLGCGDGRMLADAAKLGINAVGYEINPILYIAAKIINWPHKRKVKIVYANYWKVKWPPVDGIYVFLLQKYMPALDKKIIEYNHNIRLVSYAFEIPGKKPAVKKNALHLYIYK
jgi:SAM-dependent methyltransferase